MGYRNLEIYKKTYKLALDVHEISLSFPKYEMYETGSQLRRAAISVALNIAEGYGRRNYALDYCKFLVTSMGSCNEVSVLLEMTRDLGYLSKESCITLQDEYDHLGRQINKLIQLLKQEVYRKRRAKFYKKSE